MFPIIVDGSPEPRPEDVPESMRFFCKRQFGLAGVPILTLVAAAHWPAWIWWLSLVALVAILTAARAVMGCFGIVLNRGLAWRWPLALHREFLHGNAKASTLLRLTTFALEGAVIVVCWVLIVVRH
ncbi:MAG: hypothetical protein QE285_04425 [Aquabacterium sp.]|nr:hypothetical protein [Aquabacterium sp.]